MHLKDVKDVNFYFSPATALLVGPLIVIVIHLQIKKEHIYTKIKCIQLHIYSQDF